MMAAAVAVGSGNMKQQHSRQILRRWERMAASGERRHNVIVPKTKEQHEALLRSVGIGVG